MPQWRALRWGFTVAFFGGVLALGVPLVGHLAAGLAGGLAAGHAVASDRSVDLAGPGSRYSERGTCVPRGVTYGLFAGLLAGVVVAMVYGLSAPALEQFAYGPFAAVGSGTPLYLTALGIAGILTVLGGLGGAVGAAL